MTATKREYDLESMTFGLTHAIDWNEIYDWESLHALDKFHYCLTMPADQRAAFFYLGHEMALNGQLTPGVET